MTERPAGENLIASPRPGHRASRLALRLAAAAGSCLVLAGCEVDSFLDPSVMGRWENTPTIVPVLERIDVVERDTGEFVDVTPVLPEDLLPEATEYRVGPGDGLIILILDFFQAGQESRFEQLVDQRGYLKIPQIEGEIYVNKLTRPEIERSIGQAIRDAGLLEDAIVEVQIPSARQATFSIFGVIDRVGRYAVPSPDYRLLEALTDAGGVPPSIEKIYIIRQVTLSNDASAAAPAAATPGPSPKFPSGPPPGTPPVKPSPDQGEDLLKIINDLTGPEGAPANPAPSAPPPAPVAPPDDEAEDLESILDQETRKEPRTTVWPGVIATNRPASTRHETARPSVLRQPAAEVKEPPIDLIDQDPRALPPAAAERPAMGPPATSRWVFINGEWVQVIQNLEAAKKRGLPDEEDPLKSAPEADDVITQRVIEVPVAPLIQGVAQYNIVVRAGDTISVPGPKQGFVYLAGPGVNRPGVYQLPFTGKLTLQRLIASAGGLSPIAIPERVDLIRMVGDDRQAFVRLNIRSIIEGTQPDLFLKPDDLVNVGTNFWATPLAVFRGGLRASYGFGFLLDRNFGSDVFGVSPDARARQ